MIEPFAFKRILQHDVQQGAQRRTGQINASIAEIKLSHPLLRGENIVEAVHEYLAVLELRPQHLFGK